MSQLADVLKKSMDPAIGEWEESLRIAVVLLISFLALLIIVICSVVQAVGGDWNLVLGNQIATVGFASILCLSYFNRHVQARLILIVLCHGCILYYSRLFGSWVGLNHFFYPLLTIPFVLFSTKEKKAIALAFGIGVIVVLYFDAVRSEWLHGTYPMQQGIFESLRYVYRITSFLSIALPPMLLIALIERYRNRIHLDQSRLIDAAKFASLGEMAAGIAHEINNPLAIIIGKADHCVRLLNSSTPPDQQTIVRELTVINSTGQRIATIVKGLRTFSRDAKGDPKVATTVRSVIDDALGICQERLRSSGINVEKSFDGNPDIQLLCRQTQIVQVLVNLLSNAFDAVVDQPNPWIKITVTCDVMTFVNIAVTDSGPGIAPEIAKKVMEPFFTTKEVGRGTGLGLSLSRGIAEDHGGSLTYDQNSPNTSFKLRLPCVCGLSVR